MKIMWHRHSCLCCFLILTLTASAAPRLFYSKYFKGSVPEYVAITVEHNGDAIYQEGKTDDNPIKLHLKDADIQELFGLADKFGSSASAKVNSI